MLTRIELEAILEAFLVGLGIAETREEVRAAVAVDAKGNSTTWGAIIREFMHVRLGNSAGGPKQLGIFLRYCLEDGYISAEKLPPRAPLPAGDEDPDPDAPRPRPALVKR